jgi:hypothetical protein
VETLNKKLSNSIISDGPCPVFINRTSDRILFGKTDVMPPGPLRRHASAKQGAKHM